MNLSTCLKFFGDNWKLYLNKKMPPSSVFWKYLHVGAYFNASFSVILFILEISLQKKSMNLYFSMGCETKNNTCIHLT